MRALLQAALQNARSRGGNVNNAVAMGYCFGGAAGIQSDSQGRLAKASSTFHGGLSTRSRLKTTLNEGKIAHSAWHSGGEHYHGIIAARH